MARWQIPIAFVVVGLSSLCVIASAQRPPNIVFILADDLGYGELGCYGQEKIRTPNLDRLAADGMRFLQHYSGAPVCAPARCTLMTGQHLGHAEIRNNRRSGNGRVFAGQFPITDGVVTIAEVLKESGYATGGFGKWGLGTLEHNGVSNKQGFDRFYGYNCQRNAHSFYPMFLDSDEKEVIINAFPIPGLHRLDADESVKAEDYRAENYAPDLILEEALKFLNQQKDGPFFLYCPFTEPHVAMQPPQEWIDRYPAEWDSDHGPYRGENGYLPHPRPRAAYAAMISDLDEHVGTILNRLDQLNLADSTLIVFTSDNGPTHTSRNPEFHVGGAACKFFRSNGGLNGYKGSCYEGGIRVPCIVRWPGKVQSGSTTDFPSYFPDWFPTLAEVAGAELPKDQILDGVSLVGLVQGQSIERNKPLIWDFGGYSGIAAVRDGKWKALRRGLNTNKPQAWELYDLDSDPSESNDLASDRPEIVKQLEQKFLADRSFEPDFPLRAYDNQK